MAKEAKKSSETPDILRQGILLYKQKKYADSLAFFLALPQDTGIDGIELAYYIGLCYAKLERYDDALLYLEQVVTSGTELERVLQCRFLLAVIYALSGRRRLAEFELNKLLETGYRNASVYAAIAFIAWEQNDVKKCLEYYEKSLETAERYGIRTRVRKYRFDKGSVILQKSGRIRTEIRRMPRFAGVGVFQTRSHGRSFKISYGSAKARRFERRHQRTRRAA